MKKRASSVLAAARARKRVTGSQVPAADPGSDAADPAPTGGWDPGRTDIERPNRGQDPSIEAASRNAEAGGVEAPETLAEVKKALPFE